MYMYRRVKRVCTERGGKRKQTTEVNERRAAEEKSEKALHEKDDGRRVV